ncbi:MAG: fatty acid desaturase [Polyangiaceae bacterium]
MNASPPLLRVSSVPPPPSPLPVAEARALPMSGVRATIPRAALLHEDCAALGLFLVPLAFYAATLFAIFRVPVWARLPMGLINGFFIGLLMAVGHDACHGSFFSRRWLNQVIGRIAFLPCLFPFTFWELAHNRLHHGWTNLKSRDYVWAPFSKEEFDRLPPARRMLERVGRTFFGVGVHYGVAIWWAHLVFPSRGDRGRASKWVGVFDRLLVLAFLLAETFVFSRLAQRSGGWASLSLSFLHGVAIPFAGFLWLLGLVTFLQHNHHRVRWYDRRSEWSFARGALYGTAHVILPRAADAILLNSMFHTAHHVDARVPLYHLPLAQRALEASYGDAVLRVRFGWKSTTDTFRRCKLYDCRKHVWLDFSGRPTGA